jgi:hypothetical protein
MMASGCESARRKRGHLLAAVFVVEVRAAANGFTVAAAAGKCTSEEGE